MRVICKFGGTSTANSTQFKKIKDIIESDSNRNIIVVSAPGKDEMNNTKVTDLLYLLTAHIEYGIDYDSILESIYQRYYQIVKDLKLSNQFNDAFKDFKNTLTKDSTKDYIVSRGEYFNALILSEYLGFQFIDAMDVIILKYDGKVDYEQTTQKCKKLKEGNYVIPGFYASTPDHMLRTFDRGGSDLTGSIIAKSVSADLYENWTDVSGIYTCDPRIVNSPKRIEKITYNELRELSFRGAKVLQQESVIPLEESNIPLQIKNTNKKDDYGTYISSSIDKTNGNIITGISGTENYTALTIKKDSNTSFTKVLISVLSVFTKYQVELEHMPSGIDTFSIILKTDKIKDRYFDFINDLREIEGVLTIEEENNIALLAVVGRNMSSIPGVSGKIFNTLGKNNVNVKIIAQASKEICIIIGVLNQDYEKAVQVLYSEFYQ